MNRDPAEWTRPGAPGWAKPDPGTYHYKLWLPSSYTPDVPHDVIFIASPSGNANMGAMRDWIVAHNFVAVSLEESRNGYFGPVTGNFVAAWDDVVKRINVRQGRDARNLCTGFSGGARACSAATLMIPFNGLVLQGATTAGGEDEQEMFRFTGDWCQAKIVAVTIGTSDSNRQEAKDFAKYRKAIAGDSLKIFEFSGGHSWAPKSVVEQALDFVMGALNARAAAAAAGMPVQAPAQGGGGQQRPPISLCAGRYHTCALAGGVMKCFGLLFYHDAAQGIVIGDTLNETGKGMPAVDVGRGLSVSAMSPTCFVTQPGGGVTCPFWDYPEADVVPVDLGPGLSASAVWSEAGGGRACALLQPGDVVKCFGVNDYFQLGLAWGPDRLLAKDLGANLPPVDFGLAADGVTRLTASDMALGSQHSCALLQPGAVVKCVGYNAVGALGHAHGLWSTDYPSSFPVDFGPGVKPTKLAGASSYTCALLQPGGKVACWGANYVGQLGLGHRMPVGANATDFPLQPVDLGPGAVVTDIAVGESSACAVLTGGVLKCWGSNHDGKLGLGLDYTIRLGDEPGEMGSNLPAVDIGPGLRATSVAVGSDHVCVVTAEPGRVVKCFGVSINALAFFQNVDLDAGGHWRGDERCDMGEHLPAVDLGL
ncbi:hypothetical protein HXX76_004343 [Chlamydomonas incerta]|uniref:Uncharacterized protein n=1 Tax=Chlamydomonas incerta TaxID=51695 RepID=A0A835W8S7_CHLIN|nr:hypothetical protein HXX76_004343 [Chlamydomonas incerta]|eukprot:KAG2440231.1 hypothetical protein HXX76_004343 [Chlamydomonas incerta]